MIFFSLSLVLFVLIISSWVFCFSFKQVSLQLNDNSMTPQEQLIFKTVFEVCRLEKSVHDNTATGNVLELIEEISLMKSYLARLTIRLGVFKDTDTNVVSMARFKKAKKL